MPRILNVDDTAAQLYARSRVLQDAGYEVAEATTGTAALAAASAEPPDLILLDVNLGDVDGIEVCRRLKSDPSTKNIPVIQVSAVRTTDMDAALAAASGADFFAAAPMNDQALLTLVRALLGRSIMLGATSSAADRLAEAETKKGGTAAPADTEKIVAELAHELRDPLQAVSNWLKVLRSDAVDRARREQALAAIERNTAAQIRLVSDLLDLARAGAGQLHLGNDAVDIAGVLDEVVDDTIEQVKEHGIRITLSAERPLTVKGDRQRLSRVFANVLANAVKFSPERTEIAATGYARGHYVRVVVRDQGVGIAAELLPHVYAAHVKGSDPGAGRNEGLGLGLAISAHIVRQHGGSIEVCSPGPGHGTSVAITLPLYR